MILRGAPPRADMGAFVQDQDFYYLTGVSEPGIAMLMTIDASGAVTGDELMVPPFSPFSAKWDGAFLAPGEKTAKATGFAAATNVRALPRRLDELFDGEPATWPLLVTARKPAAQLGSTPGKAADADAKRRKDRFDGRSSRERAFLEAVAQKLPGVDVVELESFVHAMRPHKSPAEVALIEASTRIAAEGIGEAMKSCRVGAFEYQLAAVARVARARAPRHAHRSGKRRRRRSPPPPASRRSSDYRAA